MVKPDIIPAVIFDSTACGITGTDTQCGKASLTAAVVRLCATVPVEIISFVFIGCICICIGIFSHAVEGLSYLGAACPVPVGGICNTRRGVIVILSVLGRSLDPGTTEPAYRIGGTVDEFILFIGSDRCQITLPARKGTSLCGII